MRIVIGGQMGKKEIEQTVLETAREKVQITVKDDMSAAMDVKNGAADLYLGACMTGGGGALAMAIAILGYEKCQALSSGDEEEIKKAIQKGVRAFGFTPVMIKNVVPVILENYMEP